MVELLAPAGDFEALEAALMYGADGYQRTLGKILKQEEDVKKAKEQKKK